MTFTSLSFFVFLPIVLALYYALGRRSQNLLLLAASYVFYGWWDVRFLALLGASTLIDYAAARAIEGAGEDRRRRRRFLAITVTSNLTILGFFKYFNFFADSAFELLQGLGLGASKPVLAVALPVGISFYTFQSMSYAVDVYRGRLAACRSLLEFALFISYFPQLLAGPIERATSLLPQLRRDRRVEWQTLREGALLIGLGLFKKVAVADAIAPFVDVRFQEPALAAGSDLLFALYLFSIQIYCDFSGYSDIARGTSRLLGIDLMINFHHPMFATSIGDFWRRWHVSLSTWLRDYLYVPLGGSRRGRLRTYMNLMATMLLGGLWHGANWTFVIWGGLHGIYLSIARLWGGVRGAAATAARRPLPFAAHASFAMRVLLTFNAVALTRVFFRAPDLATAGRYLRGIAAWQPAGPIEPMNWLGIRLTTLLAALFVLEVAQYRSGNHTVFLHWPWQARGALYGALAIVTLVCGGLDADVPFIYFQF
jgi:D-alanyl-lipoteichoic acid acyltransferase DltB (MBOAT superfamily)